ncbi:hypothetical protein ASPZODRAFT_133145 [Penicilliopsis zonata CBS 506.65]|uniref:Uncharacterized protein n=1 Tax=Penicilliopsis zonata CBS 506.65 TaxID=1073090 RepID=A0A1L9SFT7_9EURO|nr:hypothetical protein ASPZODRAFT_133145 [Penicilliopsis zonata CBS 506.65]OJJ46145.1 hypothetical protein ASPZODRAFT_133145 [Penicilliopsis zonata CBS 506.65]
MHPISGILSWMPPSKVVRPPRYTKSSFDLQQIPWWDTLRVRRSDARQLRDLWYIPYTNLNYSPRYARIIPARETYFCEKSMYTKHKATVVHFQLRNLMSVTSYDTVEFSRESRLYAWHPAYDELQCLIDLSRPGPETGFQQRVKISSMCSRHEISVAGGFCGEYALRAAGTEDDATAVTTGFVTQNPNGITNHIDLVRHRTAGTPVVVFASNDKHLRLLDCETNTFLADQSLPWAVNCTATSSDGRLRVAIGDSPDAWVIEADSGRAVQTLHGHRDFGFACAWSPDLRHIATSNQDKTVIIWDTRMWRALETLESDVAGYRSLRFSPVGGGPRTLLLCEPADRVAVVCAQTFRSRQVHDFFGEIGGGDYSPDGGCIWVANTDRHFGGFMQFDRRQWGQRYGPGGLPVEWRPEALLDADPRCVLSARERHLRFTWSRDDEPDDLLL